MTIFRVLSKDVGMLNGPLAFEGFNVEIIFYISIADVGNK